MSTLQRPGWFPGGRPTLRSVAAVPFRLQTYRNLLYLVLALPLGVLYFVFLGVGLSVGVGLALTVVGVPVVLAVLAVATGFASAERKLTALLLGVEIDRPADSPFAADRTLVERVKLLVAGVGTWKAVVYLASKFVLGAGAFAAIMSLLQTAVTLLLVPFVYDQPGVYVGLVFENPPTYPAGIAYEWGGYLVGVRGVIHLESWQVTTLPEALGVAALGIALVVVALNCLNALAWLSGRYARFMLGDRSGSGSASAQTPA